MQNKQLRRRRVSRCDRSDHEWQVEQLESRCLLAGAVIGHVQGTTLKLAGDAAANDIVVSSSGENIQISSGANPTAISVEGDLSRVRRIDWDTGGGADQISLDGLKLDSNLTIEGDGSLAVTIVDSEVGGSFSVHSDGPLHLNVDDSTLYKRSTFRSENGDSTFDLTRATVAGPLVIRLDGAGTRNLTFTDATASRGVSIGSTAGNVTLRLLGETEIDRRFNTTVTGGTDDFAMRDSSRVNGRLSRQTIDGDSVTILEDQSVVTGLLSARTTRGGADVRIMEDAEVGRFFGSGFEVARNVVYATRAAGHLKADVYTPRSEGPHPAILAIHGGGWRFGTKSAMTARSRALADRGYVVVNIDYRLAPGSQFPDQIHDVKSAIIWMRQNAAELRIDPERIGTYGYSAGGHLALLLAMTDGSEGLEGPDADPAISTRVQAVVAGGPAVDFRDLDANDDRLSYFLGGTISELPDVYQNVSPANWISSDDPPTMIFIGENDTVVSREKVDTFVQELDVAGVHHRFHEVAGKNHLGAIGDSQALSQSAKFFDEILK